MGAVFVSRGLPAAENRRFAAGVQGKLYGAFYPYAAQRSARASRALVSRSVLYAPSR